MKTTADKGPSRRRVWGPGCGLVWLLVAGGGPIVAAGAGPGRLPPPASVRINFARDIKPILAGSCLRCHSPPRPKSGFRLDNRASALKGGDNGIDIIPGRSAQSPLVRYVAGLVQDMHMPPAGRGAPLAARQVALLRAWIDQGVSWETNAGPTFHFSLTPVVEWTTVRGNRREFRALAWEKEGWSGGAEAFDFHQQVNPDTALDLSGRARLEQNDYRVSLSLRRDNVGFTRFGFEQYRHYFDGTGGSYAPFQPSSFDPGQDLHEDIGRAWTEFGLTLPRWPRVVVGYEYQYRRGSESLLQWGPVADPAGTTKNIYPAYQDVDEKTHVLKLDLTYDTHGARLEDNFRAEFYRLQTHRVNDGSLQLGQAVPDSTVLVDESYRHFQANNSFRLEKQINPWLYASGGYLYNRLAGDGAFNQGAMLTATGGLFPYAWSDAILLDQETHLFNAAASLGPWAGLVGFAGVQEEWTAQHGLGLEQLDAGDPADPSTFFLQPASVGSDLGTFRSEENFGVRYTRIPCTVLFTDVRLEQTHLGQFGEEQPASGGFVPGEFTRYTDEVGDLKEYRAGFELSPWTVVSFNTQFKHRDKQTDYNHLLAEAFGFPNAGYPAFITRRDLTDEEVTAKMVVRPVSWLRTTLSYRLLASDYHTATAPLPGDLSPGGGVLAGNYDAQVYSLNAILTPWRRGYLSSTLSYQPSRIVTANNGVASVVPYRGDVYSLINSANYAVSASTPLRATYSYSHADYGEDNAGGGLPLGIRYTWHALQFGVRHRLRKRATLGVQYAFYYYHEPSGGDVNDFTAHAVFAMLSVKLP
jgi:Planctomycete cytochrome C